MARFERITPKHDYLHGALLIIADPNCRICLDKGRIVEAREERSMAYRPTTREVHGYCACAAGEAAKASDVKAESDFRANEWAAQCRADDRMNDHWTPPY